MTTGVLNFSASTVVCGKSCFTEFTVFILTHKVVMRAGTCASTVSRLIVQYVWGLSASATFSLTFTVPKLDKKTWKQRACHFGELYPHLLGNRSLKLSETVLFLSSQNKAEWLSKEEYVFKLNIFLMPVLLCVVYLLLLLLILSFHF